MVELKGTLGSIGLPAIVQLIGELHHSGNLEMTRSAARGVLGFDDGRLVAATYEELQGLNALAACVLELADGDFQFVEGVPAGDRTMDLGGGELLKLLDRLMSGELSAETLELGSVRKSKTEQTAICPLLGFVDDRNRHYSRPTALHRCFAAGAAGLVTGQEQREFCLSGRYSTCPRYRRASLTTTSAPAPAALQPLPAPTPAPAPARGIPAGVAARMAAANHMRMADATSGEAVVAEIQHADEPSVLQRVALTARIGSRPRRGLLLVAVGAGLGLVLLIVGLGVAMPALNGGLAAQKPSGAVAQQQVPAVPPVQTAPPVPTPTSVPRQTAVPTIAPTALPISQPVPPTAQSVPKTAVLSQASVATSASGQSNPVLGQPLIDARFAAGPKPGWLDNPPYAIWSDGAYRLTAPQPTHFVAVGVPVDRLMSDVVVTATFRKTGGPPGGGYGLVVRDQSPEPLDGITQNATAYVLETGDLGEFGVWRRDGDHWVDLVPWTRSTSVRPGGSPNELAVRAIGNRLTFTVNGTELATVQDDTLPSGGVGVFVGGDYNEVALDRFTVQLPD
jgi:hypothetical protein